MSDDLDSVIARAQQECPITIDTAAFREHLRDVAAGSLASIHAGDLLLAFACSRPDDAALRHFESQYGAMLADAVKSVDRANADDVLQELRRRLFVTDGDASRPRILGYRGTGPLGGWVRVAALRLAIDLKRSGWRETSLEDALVPDQAQPVGARTEDRDVIRTALRTAIAAQPSKTRALLRYYYCEHVGVEELGRIYRVHASTVSRWLDAARTAIFEQTRTHLAAALDASPTDVESHLGLANGLDVSLRSLLATPRPV